MKPASSRIERIRYELKMREVEVSRIESIGSHTLAITFSGASLADFQSASFDDHVKFMFDVAGETIRRDYTPRQFSQKENTLTIEFALHENGYASNWARNARIGQRATIGGPRGSMIIPMDYSWHLLAGDLSALPAIRRRLAELPAGTQATVIALAANPADHLAISSAAQIKLHWVQTETELLAALREFSPPDNEGFAWFAGESALALSARAVLQDKGLAKENMRVAAYWKRGAADFHERLD